MTNMYQLGTTASYLPSTCGSSQSLTGTPAGPFGPVQLRDVLEQYQRSQEPELRLPRRARSAPCADSRSRVVKELIASISVASEIVGAHQLLGLVRPASRVAPSLRSAWISQRPFADCRIDLWCVAGRSLQRGCVGGIRLPGRLRPAGSPPSACSE